MTKQTDKPKRKYVKKDKPMIKEKAATVLVEYIEKVKPPIKIHSIMFESNVYALIDGKISRTKQLLAEDMDLELTDTWLVVTDKQTGGVSKIPVSKISGVIYR